MKISFYRRLQKELSTDIGIISGNIFGENFILEYGLDRLATKRITPKQIYVKTCLGRFCIFRFWDDTSLLEHLRYRNIIDYLIIQEVSIDPEKLKKSFIQGSKNRPYANDLKYLVKNLNNINFT
jgi:hypothetical protein